MLQKPQVAMLSHYFLPDLGGVEKHSAYLAQNYQRLGWQVDIVTTGGDLDRERSEPISSLDRAISQLNIHRFTFPKIKFIGLFKIWWQLVTRFGTLFSQADLIHVHDVMLWYLPLRLLFPHKRVVLTVHGWEGVYPLPLKYKLIKWLGCWLADEIICVGEYIGRHYQIKCDQVVYGGFDQDRLISESDVTAKHSGFNSEQSFSQRLSSNQPLNLVYLGRLAADTGLPILLKALESLNTRTEIEVDSQVWRIKFIGDGPLRTDCEQLGQVTGMVKQIEPHLQTAQIAVVGGYLSGLEALAAGCKVLAVADHQLKQDYWQLSPFSHWVEIVAYPDELLQILTDYARDYARQSQSYPSQHQQIRKKIIDYSWKNLPLPALAKQIMDSYSE